MAGTQGQGGDMGTCRDIRDRDMGDTEGHGGDTDMGTYGDMAQGHGTMEMWMWGHMGTRRDMGTHGDTVGTWGHAGTQGYTWGHRDTYGDMGTHGNTGPWGHMGTPLGHHGDTVGTPAAPQGQRDGDTRPHLSLPPRPFTPTPGTALGTPAATTRCPRGVPTVSPRRPRGVPAVPPT